MGAEARKRRSRCSVCDCKKKEKEVENEQGEAIYSLEKCDPVLQQHGSAYARAVFQVCGQHHQCDKCDQKVFLLLSTMWSQMPSKRYFPNQRHQVHLFLKVRSHDNQGRQKCADCDHCDHCDG